VKPRVGITLGDPAGIGPEIAAKAVADVRVLAACEPVVYGPHGLVHAFDLQTPDSGLHGSTGSPRGSGCRAGNPAGPEQVEGRTPDFRLPQFPPGELSAAAGRAAYEAIVAAVADARAGRIAAMVTCPVNKEAFAMAGLPWRGHTDLLAHLTASPFVAMMFYSPRLIVVLMTVHVALADVPALITPALVERVVRLTARELPRFVAIENGSGSAGRGEGSTTQAAGHGRSRIAVAGLNPHAGEHGLIGDEDERVLRPTVQALASAGIDVSGPVPADTVFVRAMKGDFDAVVACYHDQGLIPIKMASFGRAVNVTLGLPIIRTSVDHGTAFDIAGRGIADPGSLIEAILLAARLAGQQGR
jgi:4-hydroxythreonine-4-phosphate dehydrogenase